LDETLAGNWVAAPGDIAGDATFEEPYIYSLHDNPDSIMADQVGGTFWVADILNKTLLNLPAPYFINYYGDAEDVTDYGNIKGSHRIVPFSINDGSISKIDPKVNSVIYSKTGLESSIVTAWLGVLGYETETLLFGLSGMIYSDLDDADKYMAPEVDLPYIEE